MIIFGAIISLFSVDQIKIGFEAEKKGDIKKAIEVYNKILSESPDNNNIRWRLATLYAKNNMLDKEAETLKILVKKIQFIKFENELTAHLRLANYYHSSGQMENFFLEIKKVLFFNPNHSESILFLAMLYAANDMYSKAIVNFLMILNSEPNNKDSLFYMALCSLSLNERDKCEYYLNNLLTLEPDNPDALTVMGYLKKPTDLDIAIDYFNRAINTEKNFDLMDYAPLYNAVCLMKKHEYEEAYLQLSNIEIFAENKTLDYKSELYFSLAWAAHKNGKPVLSEKWWEKLVTINFTYMDLFGQYKIHNLLSFEMVNKKWNDMYKSMTLPSIKIILAQYTNLNIRNMESVYDDWALGKKQKKSTRKKNITCYTISEFINLNYNELLSFSKKIVEKMSFRVEKELDNKSGYDCITQKDLNGHTHLIQVRNWSSIVSDGPVKELYNAMQKKDVNKGILVIAGMFTKKAQKAGMDLGISLIDKEELKALMF